MKQFNTITIIVCRLRYVLRAVLITGNILLVTAASAQVQKNVDIYGKVVSGSTNEPLADATLRIKGVDIGVRTDSGGNFMLHSAMTGQTILCSFLGYKTKAIKVSEDIMLPLEIVLDPAGATLQAIEVSTGYQSVPKERATGSFDFISNRSLERETSTNILSRLEGIAGGLTFNKNKGSAGNTISIRGLNTLYANAQPLIVLNNFPYDGDINSINPNDVESITILKDAAAASIWGARAGNGVIVIKTKEGGFNQPLKLSANMNITMGERPDLFYRPQLSAADFITIEEMLFDKGFYNRAENSIDHSPLTPVVELLIAKRDGKISAKEADNQINDLKKIDVRNDFEKYFYRKSMNQQYALNMHGGTKNGHYYLSGGFDKNLDNAVGNGYQRITFRASNDYALAKHKLILSSDIYYTLSTTWQNNPGYNAINMASGTPLYPYARIADQKGNALPIIHDYRFSYATDAVKNGLMDWEYEPLEELKNNDNNIRANNLLLNLGATYHFSDAVKAEILYHYEKDISEGQNLMNVKSYYARNLINQFTQINPDSTLSYPVPRGGILDRNVQAADSWNIRSMVTINKKWGRGNGLNAIGGVEIQDVRNEANAYRLYGYDDLHVTSIPVDYITMFQKYYNQYSSSTIPYNNYSSDLSDRYISYFINASYAYKDRYTFSGSARFDQSNLFGVKANQRGVPLWSSGVSWNISNEPFYHFKAFPYLKLRVTYGYNGNVDKSVTAYTTAQVSSSIRNYLTNLPFAKILNPPNPELRWERVRMLNLGIDFESRRQVVSGSIEGYFKRGMDLIGFRPTAPSTGITLFQGNTAGTKGSGVDVQVSIRNINRAVKWTTSFLFSYSLDKVTNYKVESSISNYLQFADGNGIYPMEGRPLYALYSFPWGGLDPKTGDPQGYLNGKLTEDYASIINSYNPGDLVYNGPARPPFFGSMQNVVSWEGLSLSFNIIYRFGYYFRRNSIKYTALLNGLGGHPDFDKRWKQPGDEKETNVPSMPDKPNNYRNQFYTFSEVLVEKAGNIRLHDVSLQYDFSKIWKSKGFPKGFQLYLYARNLGILWKANRVGLDPDYLDLKPVKQVSIGIRTEF